MASSLVYGIRKHLFPAFNQFIIKIATVLAWLSLELLLSRLKFFVLFIFLLIFINFQNFFTVLVLSLF